MTLTVFNLASCNGDNNRYYAENGLEVSLKKIANPPTITQAGEVITYTYEVKYSPAPTLTNKNLGVPLSGMTISISDSPLDNPVSCPKTVLNSNESVTCTATYTVTEADIAAGGVTNNASATGTFTSSDTQEVCGVLTKIVLTNHSASAKASVTVKAPVKSNVVPPAVVPPTSIPPTPELPTPILTGDVPYCDLASHAMNLRLAEGFVAADFNHKLTIGGETMGCKVSEANSTILSCQYPPTTVFPASIQATLNGNIVNEFEFSGATCTLPDRPKGPGGENDPPVIDACANDPSPDCLPVYCTYHPSESICLN
jgi:hypothetical protein